MLRVYPISQVIHDFFLDLDLDQSGLFCKEISN